MFHIRLQFPFHSNKAPQARIPNMFSLDVQLNQVLMAKTMDNGTTLTTFWTLFCVASITIQNLFASASLAQLIKVERSSPAAFAETFALSVAIQVCQPVLYLHCSLSTTCDLVIACKGVT